MLLLQILVTRHKVKIENKLMKPEEFEEATMDLEAFIQVQNYKNFTFDIEQEEAQQLIEAIKAEAEALERKKMMKGLIMVLIATTATIGTVVYALRKKNK